MKTVSEVEGRLEFRAGGSAYDAARAELAAEFRQLLLGLGYPGRAGTGRTFGELAAAWLKRIEKRRVQPQNERGYVKHMAPLWNMREGELTKGAIDDLFGSLQSPAGPLGPATLNKVRSAGRLIIRDAMGNREWGGANPFDLVRRLREPRPIYNTLSIEEVTRVLACLREDRRRLAKTIIMVGIRPGEGLGLKKVDVDIEKRLMRVRRSHGRDQTKTGKEREFPIPDALIEDLREAINASPSEYVFPKADGTRQRSDTKLANILRTALKAANLVTGYRYHCRRSGCEFVEELEAKVEISCPRCFMRLWCEPIPRALRFYDLRHSSATLHRKAKCDPLVIQEMMGHSPGNTTDGVYTHLDENYRREQLNKLDLGDE